MRNLVCLIILASICIGGSACSKQVGPAECDRIVEGIINAENPSPDPNPADRVLVSLERQVPASCRSGSQAQGYSAAKAFFSYASGRVNEAEQLIGVLDWRNTDQVLALSTATYLIVDHRRLDGSLDTAERLARRYIRLSPGSIRARHLLGEVMMEKGSATDVVEVFDEMKALRRDSELKELHDYDIDYIPYLSEMERHGEVIAIFRAAESGATYPVWEREDLIFSALLAASELGENDVMEQLISETRTRRPDIAAKESFRRISRSFDLLKSRDGLRPISDEQ
jgi:hypothetical protein